MCIALFVSSTETVNDGRFHTVELVTFNRMVNLSVDGGEPTTLDSQGRSKPVTGEAPLYVGGKSREPVGSQEFSSVDQFNSLILSEFPLQTPLPVCLSPRRHAGGGDAGLPGPLLSGPQHVQLPRLHQEPLHQPRAAGLHPQPHEAGGGAGLPGLSQALLPARYLPTQRSSGTTDMFTWPLLTTLYSFSLL